MPEKPIRVAADSALGVDYIAGFVDGEGSISFSRNNSKVRVKNIGGEIKTSSVSYFPVVTIVNTNQNVLESIQSFVGCGHIYKRKDNRSPKHSTTYSLCFSSRRSILDFLELIKDSLIVKRVQAEAMYSFLKLRESKVGHLCQNSPYSLDELELIEMCKEANKSASYRAVGFRKEDFLTGLI